MASMSNQKNPILAAHWDEGEAHVPRVRQKIRIRLSPYVWVPDWLQPRIACFCPAHKS